MSRLDDLLKEAKNHFTEVYNTLDKGSTGRNIRHDKNALISTINRAFPATAHDPQYASMDDLLAFGGVGTGTFIGKNALTWDAKAAKKAAGLLKRGIDPEKVWNRHMTGQMPDGALFQEIDDSVAKGRGYQLTPKEALDNARTTAIINDNPQLWDRLNSIKPYSEKSKNMLLDEYKRTGEEIANTAMGGNIELAKQLQEQRGGLDAILSEMGGRKYGEMSRFLSHGKLGQAYPDIYKMHTRIDGDLTDYRGQYSPGSGSNTEQIILKEKPDWKQPKSTALHEIQHAVQDREGWATGGNVREMGDKLGEYYGNSKKYEKLAADILSGKSQNYDELSTIENYLSSNKNLKNITPEQAYRALTGEAQSRATQDRMEMNMDERRANYPLKGGMLADIPLNQLIYKYDTNSPNLSISEATKRYKNGLLDPSFRGSHGAPMKGDSTAALHELNKIYPDDIYSPQAAQYYGHGENVLQDRMLFNQLKGLRDKPDEMIDVYRALPKDAPMEINHGDWVTTNKEYAVGHGKSVLDGNYKIKKMKVPVKTLFTNGDSPYEFGLDLSVLDKPKGLPPTEFSKAHATAQRNAMLPVEQGGLGLPENNTAMDRARAMGFDISAYHGTNYPVFDKFNTDGADFTKTEGTGAFFSRNPELASSYTDIDYPGSNPALIPVMLRTGKKKNIDFGGNNWSDYKGKSTDEYVRKARASGKYDSVDIRNVNDAGMGGYDINGDTLAIFSPKDIRSRFAAFDPLNKNSANILASLLAGTALINDKKGEKK